MRVAIALYKAAVVFGAIFEYWEFAVGGALSASGHLAAAGELYVGFDGLECCGWVVAAFVEGG